MRYLSIITVLLFGVSMSACSWPKEDRTVLHSIGRAPNDKRTEILEEQYGDSWHTSGSVNMPPADFLYVKWRDKTTGQVYEDRVDLRNRLPSFREMYEQTVYFLVEDNQLYVYLIPAHDWNTKRNHKPPGQRPNGPYATRHLDVKTLYPDNDPPRVRGDLSKRLRAHLAQEAREEGRNEDQ